MKVGELIKVKDCMPGVHPVGLIVEIIPEDPVLWKPERAMVAYLDGDYEEMDNDVEYEVLSESR